MCNPSGSNYSDIFITTLHIRPMLAGELKHYEILSYFSAFGDVRNIRIHNVTEHSYGFVNSASICNETKHSYGFVKFNMPESAAKALQIDSHIIAGRRVNVAVADDRHQDIPTLLDLNDDCIHEILSMKCLSAIDLCSVAETCRRLKEIASQLFKVQHKECDIRSLSNSESEQAERILMNFGSEISDLHFIEERSGRKWARKLLPSIAEYCSLKLQSLNLQNFEIPENFTAKLQPLFKNLRKLKLEDCTFHGTSKELFSDCGSLVELNISQYGDSTRNAFILENTFPKLQQFVFFSSHLNEMGSFISRHMNLTSFEIQNEVESSALQLISGLRRLETLTCRIPDGAILDLSNLGHLRELKITCGGRNFMTMASGLENLIFLEHLRLDHARIDSEFIRALPKLTRLQALKLWFCTGLQNLHQVDDLNQLTTLQIFSAESVDLDIVFLVHRLSKLNHLGVAVAAHTFKIYLANYLRIVEAVRGRRDRSKLRLCILGQQIDNYDEVSTHFARNAHLVEMIIGFWWW